MASPATAKPLGYGTCCTALPSKDGEVCGARVLWKLDKQGRAFYQCKGQYDGKTCGVTHGPLSEFETSHLVAKFEKAKPDEPKRSAVPAGKRAQEADPDGEPGTEPDGCGERDPEPEAPSKSGYVFDQ